MESFLPRSAAGLALAGLLAAGSAPAHAAELTPGTRIDASNVDAVQADTFGGHAIADLMPPSMRLAVKQAGMVIELHAPTPLQYNQRVVKATELQGGQAGIDANRKMTGYTTGIPFLKLDPADPQSGLKLVYNIMRSPWFADAVDFQPMVFLTTSKANGLTKELYTKYGRLLQTGRLSTPYAMTDDGVIKRELMMFTYPNDVRGVGTLTVQYADGRLPDVYAYVKAVRRVRRLSGSAWADPVVGTDLLTDETFGLNIDPTWYPDYKITGKRWILASLHSKTKGAQLDAGTPQERYDALTLAPGNGIGFTEAFEPREVWTLEATPPNGHLASRKLIYVDTDPYYPLMHWQEIYDRKGELWRLLYHSWVSTVRDDGQPGVFPSIIWVPDLQRERATWAYLNPTTARANFAGADPSNYSPEAIPRLLQ
jgi:hypothetical protein